jgi:hypothetical protein
MSEELYKEVFNPATDSDGYTPIYYLSEELKSLLESFRKRKLL